MQGSTKRNVIIGSIVAIAIMTSAAAAHYITKESMTAPKQQASAKSHVIASKPAAAPQQYAAKCDDGNIVGTIAGGAAGGVLGSQIGNGSGKTAATIGGTLGGAYVGNTLIPTRNMTCR